MDVRKRKGLLTMVFLISSAISQWSAADPVPLQDSEMKAIVGREGFGISLRLVATSQIQLGPAQESGEVYLGLDDTGGVLDLFGMRIAVGQRPDGLGDYIGVSMPGFIGADEFGVGAIRVYRTDSSDSVNLPSYGAFRVNGVGAMTGQLMFWGN